MPGSSYRDGKKKHISKDVCVWRSFFRGRVAALRLDCDSTTTSPGERRETAAADSDSASCFAFRRTRDRCVKGDCSTTPVGIDASDSALGIPIGGGDESGAAGK